MEIIKGNKGSEKICFEGYTYTKRINQQVDYQLGTGVVLSELALIALLL